MPTNNQYLRSIIPIDWNQINEEDSSVSGYGSSHDHQSFQIAKLKINNVISNEKYHPINLKPKNSINDHIEENLQKLYLLSSRQVWLFVPQPFQTNTFQQNYYTLKTLTNQQIIPNHKGWNILIPTKQQAKKLIQFGFKNNNIHFNFYVSSKNYHTTTVSQINRKGQASSKNLNENLKYDSPCNQSQKRQKQKSRKKKLKFIQKNNGQKLINQHIIEVNKSGKENEKDFLEDESIEPIRQQYELNLQNHQNLSKTLAQQILNQGQTIIDGLIPMDLKCERIGISQTQNLRCQVNTISMKDQINHSHEENLSIQFNEKGGQNISVSLSSGYDSEESLQRMKRALKKKNKKLNKKKRNPHTQTNYTDENNPFCLFGN